MSYTAEQWRTAVTNLLKMTSKGELSWERSDLFQGDAWIEVTSSFEAVFKGKLYVISSTKSRHYIDEFEYYWVGGYDLSIFEVGFNNTLIASAPRDLSILRSLFEAAEKSFAFARKALDDLL